MDRESQNQNFKGKEEAKQEFSEWWGGGENSNHSWGWGGMDIFYKNTFLVIANQLAILNVALTLKSYAIFVIDDLCYLLHLWIHFILIICKLHYILLYML